MPIYRAYRLDAERQFRSGVWMDARNDADALSQAEALCDPTTPYVEVRASGRVVDEIACAQQAAISARHDRKIRARR